MAALPMVGARCPVEWQQKFRAIAQATERSEAAVIREALGRYLGLVDPSAVKRVIDDHEQRLTKLEQR
ncbi:hypothetical protein [Tolypothrix sp. VBCCA 56010]|uniref:hypothetical protein n=1 Tax=Tolypothrix sp. VBCCA 56010 TaxID=3137731 RepID=UPI003D7E418A